MRRGLRINKPAPIDDHERVTHSLALCPAAERLLLRRGGFDRRRSRREAETLKDGKQITH